MADKHAYGTRFEKVDTLPSDAMKVSLYAKLHGISQPAYINVKYSRYLTDGGEKPPYKIINFQGSNFVIPD
jgi:hypothetical protein